MKITLYEKDRCMPCLVTKRHLDKLEVEYNIVNLDHDEEAMQLLINQGFMQSPVVKVVDETGREVAAWAGFYKSKIEYWAKEQRRAWVTEPYQ